MDSEARHPDTPGRLRIVDLRIGSERQQLHFGGGFACVLAGTDARSAAARWIATTIVGPPPATFDDRIDPGEEPVWRLQAPLLPLRAPAVIDRALLQTIWRSDCARRLELIDASREAIQLDRSRISGALERVRVQPPLSAAAAASRPRPGEADEELAAFKAAARRFVIVQSLLAEIDAFVPQVTAEALELADEWDEHLASLDAVPAAPDPETQPDEAKEPDEAGEPGSRARPPIEYLPERAPSEPAGPVDEARGAELEQLHRAAVKAEARLFRRGFLPRKRAIARFNDARLREQAALAGAGVDTYGEFLHAQHAAERHAEPAGTEAASSPVAAPVADPAATQPAAATENPTAPPAGDETAERAARTQELRARARAILGHEPGSDVSVELRSEPTEPAGRAERVEALAEVLREEGFPAAGTAAEGDVIERARAFIATPPSVHIPQPPTWAMRVSKTEVPLSELEGLEHQLNAKDEMIGGLDVESARITSTRDLELLRLGPEDLERVVSAMFDAYRAGEVLEGHLPLVLDGVVDGLAADAREAAVHALAAVDDIQVIVVTDEEIVTRLVREAGGAIVHWPATESRRRHDRSR
jgi:hypothetical protein